MFHRKSTQNIKKHRRRNWNKILSCGEKTRNSWVFFSAGEGSGGEGGRGGWWSRRPGWGNLKVNFITLFILLSVIVPSSSFPSSFYWYYYLSSYYHHHSHHHTIDTKLSYHCQAGTWWLREQENIGKFLHQADTGWNMLNSIIIYNNYQYIGRYRLEYLKYNHYIQILSIYWQIQVKTCHILFYTNTSEYIGRYSSTSKSLPLISSFIHYWC